MIIAYTFFNELLGFFIRYTEGFAFFSESTTDNDILFNIYTLVFFGYFYFTYLRLIQTSKYRRIIGILIAVAVITFLLNAIFLNPLTTNLFYATCVCSWVLVGIIYLYFKEKEDWRWSIEKYNLMSWVSIGLGVFYFFLPVLFLIGFLNFDFWEKYNLRTTLKILIILMYTLFCIGFVISRRRAFR